MYEINGRIIHGLSFVVSLSNIEFITWRRNEETGDYWVKFHVPSGKEIRIKVTEFELRDIVDTWAECDVILNIGDEYGLDN